jgi:SAM-dependent methyltransferase
MEKIIYRQLDATLSIWGNSIEKHFPNEFIFWSDADKHLQAHKERWNLFSAVDLVKTYASGKKGLKCLDLGCGTGWLTAALSSLDNVKYIDAIDSDERMLEKMLPQIVEKLAGNMNKINRIHGLFTPILTTPAGGYDFIFMSSAAHHHDNIFDLISELEKSVATGGYIFLLNEVPIPDWKYRFTLLKLSLKALYHTFKTTYKGKGQSILMNGILYDPILGDISYSNMQWKKILAKASTITWKRVETGVSSYKGKKGPQLVHFIGEKRKG